MTMLAGIISSLLLRGAAAAVLDFGSLGGQPDDSSLSAAWANQALLNQILNQLAPGDTFVLPGAATWHTMGGVAVRDLTDVVLSFDGILKFSEYIDDWPTKLDPEHKERRVLPCLDFHRCSNITLTSRSERGTIDGTGQPWWGIAFAGYLEHGENRPRILEMHHCKDVVLEKLLLLDSAYWTTSIKHVSGLVIRHSDISSRRTRNDGHSLLDLTAFNTDGFDFGGRDIHVHDCTVYSQDDCVTIKGDTENVLVERVNVSGLGLTIGSIGSDTVRNVTFRDSYLHNSYKGLYLKFRDSKPGGLVEDVLYENIIIDNNEQWPIWIGPAQQSDTKNICAAHPCSICWPTLPGTECGGVSSSTYRNLTFRNIEIRNPKGSPGVIMASDAAPIEGLVFDNVRVTMCGEDYGSFEETFPMLPTDIYDKYITRFFLIVAALVNLLVLLPCACCVRKGCCTCAFWSARPRFKVGAAGCGALWGVGAVVVGGWLASVNAAIGDSAAYYRCEGVVGGVATGNTWPVPSCLRDDTDDDSSLPAPPTSCPPLSAGAVAAVVLAVLLCVALLAVALLKWRRPLLYEQLSRAWLGYWRRLKSVMPVTSEYYRPLSVGPQQAGVDELIVDRL